MFTCTFLGHRSVPNEIEPTLRSTLIDLIVNHDVKLFYVGNHGSFDAMVRRVLKSLSAEYPIKYYVVLAYLPGKRRSNDPVDYTDTIFPEGIETAPKRFAISHRNRWMIERSDYVVTYVIRDCASGAAQYKKLAERKGKAVIELSSANNE